MNEALKTILGGRLKELRKTRGLKQEDLYRFLGISQPQYSKIESGQASLTAEQLIQLIKRFNLSLSEILPSEESEEESLLQNALIRLGAKHLREISDLVPSERFESPNEAISQILLTAPSARLIAALVPVLAKNYNKVNFNWVEEKLHRQGLERRLGWLIDAAIQSLEKRLEDTDISRDLDFIYGRAIQFLERKKKIPEFYISSSTLEDELDPDLTSPKTLASVEKKRDELARKWRIVTRITSDDFYQALKDAEK
jgi:transcriptional regulator with XRE-family HTH domain